MRDYDKEPLIFKSYEEFFQSKAYIWILSIIAAMLSAFVAFFIQDIFEKGWDAGKIEYINTIKNTSLFSIAIIVIFIIVLIFLCIKTFKHSNSEIKLKNNTIDFIKNDELEHTSEISFDIYRSCSPIASVSIISLKLKRSIDIALIIIASILLFLKPVLLILFLGVYLSPLIAILINIAIYFYLNKTFKNFKPFSILIFSKPVKITARNGSRENRYYSIFIYSNKMYKELREYFLTTKNIDIDKLRKEYSIY